MQRGDEKIHARHEGGQVILQHEMLSFSLLLSRGGGGDGEKYDGKGSLYYMLVWLSLFVEEFDLLNEN